MIGSYIHMGGKIGVLVEVNCESDFVARTDDFQSLVKEVAMHIAAADPKWVRREDVPAEAIEKEKSIYRAQMENTGKPAAVLEKIVEGKLGSFYSQFVLLDQPSIRDNNVSIAQLIGRPARRPAKTSRSTGSSASASATLINADVHPSPFSLLRSCSCSCSVRRTSGEPEHELRRENREG